MDLEKARKLLADAEVVHDADAVQAALEVVAGKIRTQLADKNPLVLCVMTGGVIFCGQLLPKLDFPLDFDYLHATRYGPETQGGKISWRMAPWTPVTAHSRNRGSRWLPGAGTPTTARRTRSDAG